MPMYQEIRRMHRWSTFTRSLLASALVATVIAPANAAAADPPSARQAVRPAGETGPWGNERLSDEHSLTRWAWANQRGKIRARANRFARPVANLRYYTEHGSKEPYLVLRSHVDSKDRVWFQVRVPGRPNGRTGWVLKKSLTQLRVTHDHLRINRTTLRATFYQGGRVVWSSRIGVGKSSTPTPRGRFYVRDKLNNRGGNPVYGPVALGTSAYSGLVDWALGGVVGIHGTNQPGLIPGRPSNGCIRVPNHKIVKLFKLVSPGTPIEII